MATTIAAAISLPATTPTPRVVRRRDVTMTAGPNIIDKKKHDRPLPLRRPRRTPLLTALSRGAVSANASSAASDQSEGGELEVPRWHYRDLINEGRVFRETFPVRFDEVGPDKRATMHTVATMVQECACNHAQGLWGLGQSMPTGMLAESLGWVCARLHIVVNEYPRWGDQVEVSTWFESQGRVAARRDWEMTSIGNGGGVETSVGVATSQWVAFNVEKRKLARIPVGVVEEFKCQALADSPVMGADYVVEKLPDVRDGSDSSDDDMTLTVRRSDVDMNGHVNNVVYVEWLLESIPARVWQSHELKELELEFRSECNYGDVVDALCRREEREPAAEDDARDASSSSSAAAAGGEVRMVHMLLKRGVGAKEAEVVRARTVWEPKDDSTEAEAEAEGAGVEKEKAEVEAAPSR